MVMLKKLLIAFFVLINISSCSLFSSKKASCVFPDDTTADAPLWLCSEELVQAFVPEYSLKVLLDTELYPEDFILQKNELLQQAGPKLAVNLQKLFIESLNQSSVFLDFDDVQRKAFENTIQFDRMFELEIRLVRNRTSPNGVLYGVVGVSDASIEFIINQIIAQLKLTQFTQWQRIGLGNEKIIAFIQQSLKQTAATALRQQRRKFNQ